MCNVHFATQLHPALCSSSYLVKNNVSGSMTFWLRDCSSCSQAPVHQPPTQHLHIYISTHLHSPEVWGTATQIFILQAIAAVLQCSVTLKCSEMIMFRLGLILAIKRSIVPHFSAEINCILMQKQWKLLMFRCCSYFKNAILHRLCRVENTLYSRASRLQVFHDTMICTMKDIKQFLWASFIMRGGA